MARFLFWNINRKPIAHLIATICHTNQVDVLILAESEISGVDMLLALNEGREQKFNKPFNLSKKLDFYIRYPRDAMESISDEGGFALRRLQHPIGPSILLAAMHLPSKREYSDDEQHAHATRISRFISDAETREGHARTIVVGDLNMNPFEPGMVSFEGFHSVMDRTVADRKHRVVQGQRKSFFYNPMWSNMGDESDGPAGTYYRSESTPIAYFWHTFDHVLIRPALLSVFPQDGMRVLTSANGQSLLKGNGQPDPRVGSDHLPLLFELRLEELDDNGN